MRRNSVGGARPPSPHSGASRRVILQNRRVDASNLEAREAQKPVSRQEERRAALRETIITSPTLSFGSTCGIHF